MRFKRDTLISYSNTALHQDSTNFLLEASRYTHNALLAPDTVPSFSEPKGEGQSSTIRQSAVLPSPETVKLWKEKGCLYERILKYLKSKKQLLKNEGSSNASSDETFDDDFESLPSLTEPDVKNIKKWKEMAATKLMGDLTSLDLCSCNADLIDMIEEGEAFTEHSFMDHFLSSVNGQIVVPPSTAALVTSENDDEDYQVKAPAQTNAPVATSQHMEPSNQQMVVPGKKVDYTALISEQDALHQQAEASYKKYCELMDLFRQDQVQRFERLRRIILPLFSTPEHFEYAIQQQQQLQQEIQSNSNSEGNAKSYDQDNQSKERATEKMEQEE